MDKPKSCDCGKNIIIQKFQYMDHDKKKIIIDDENYILYCPTCDIYMNPMPLKELIKKWNIRQSKSIELINYELLFEIFSEVLGYTLLNGEYTDFINELENRGYKIVKER